MIAWLAPPLLHTVFQFLAPILGLISVLSTLLIGRQTNWKRNQSWQNFKHYIMFLWIDLTYSTVCRSYRAPSSRSGSKLKEKKIKDKIMAMPTTLGLNWGFVETSCFANPIYTTYERGLYLQCCQLSTFYAFEKAEVLSITKFAV